MSCDCIERVNAELVAGDINTKVSMSFVFYGPGKGVYPVIQTELIEKKRGQKAAAMLPTYCPFCGTKYVEKEPQ